MTSHQLYEMATPILFEILKLDFGLTPQVQMFRTIKARPRPTRFCRHVRSIIVMGPDWLKYGPGDPFRELSKWDVDLICNLFELAERLDDF